jgi:cytochrome c-type biogenesis protein CcmH/NrfG
MYVLSVAANRRTGFIFALLVVAIIVGSVSVLYSTGRHFASAYTFTESIRLAQQGSDISTIEGEVLSAYQLSQSDVYARRIAEYQFNRITSLFNVQEPTPAQQEEFNVAVRNGIQSATEAKNIDPSESSNWAVLGAIYSTLVTTTEGAYDPALEALTKARELNPKNPLPLLELAILEGRVGNYDAARGHVNAAIGLKPNFTDALFYLSQLDIMTGNVDGAIQSTLAMINLEPQNPARYYQLGVLETSKSSDQTAIDRAIDAFEKAVELDQNYANARYLLALAYDVKGRGDEAKAQLERVLELNPGNTEVQTLIDIISAEGSLQGALLNAQANQTVDEATSVQEDNGTVTTGEAPNTPLVTPVNRAPAPGETRQETTPGPGNTTQ